MSNAPLTNSPQAKKVKEIGKRYLEKVKTTKPLGVVQKERKKKKKLTKALGLLEKCKIWGRAVTESNIEELKKLSEDQLLT